MKTPPRTTSRRSSRDSGFTESPVDLPSDESPADLRLVLNGRRSATTRRDRKEKHPQLQLPSERTPEPTRIVRLVPGPSTAYNNATEPVKGLESVSRRERRRRSTSPPERTRHQSGSTGRLVTILEDDLERLPISRNLFAAYSTDLTFSPERNTERTVQLEPTNTRPNNRWNRFLRQAGNDK